MHRNRAIAAVLFGIILLTSWITVREAAACDTCCFKVYVEFRGRTPVAIINNIQYYRWTYRVYGTGCINSPMSSGYWVLDMCSEKAQDLREISTQSVDSSDPSHGTTTVYEPIFGRDRATNHTGLKWMYRTGNPIDRPGEYDEFSFVASGNVTQVGWVAHGQCANVCGCTWGPGCGSVATEQVTWSAVKSMYR